MDREKIQTFLRKHITFVIPIGLALLVSIFLTFQQLPGPQEESFEELEPVQKIAQINYEYASMLDQRKLRVAKATSDPSRCDGIRNPPLKDKCYNQTS